MFPGLLYCADCGSELGYSAVNSYKREQACFFCSGYHKNTDVCSAPYIRERVVEQLVLEDLQRLLRYVQVYEKQPAKEQMERFGLQEKKALTEKRWELDRVKQVTRLTELTLEFVHEFIEKIVVSKAEKADGQRRQAVDIYYNTIGIWNAPEPEVLEREYLDQYKAMQKRKKRLRSPVPHRLCRIRVHFQIAPRRHFLTECRLGGRFFSVRPGH